MNVEVEDVMTRDCRECAPEDTLATAALRMWEADCAVSQMASQEVVACAPDDDVAQALATMGHKRLRRLPVLAAGRLVGMLSLNDSVTCEGENPEVSKPILATLEAISSHRALPAAA